MSNPIVVVSVIIALAIGFAAGRFTAAPSPAGSEPSNTATLSDAGYPVATGHPSGEPVIGPCEVRKVIDGDEFYAWCGELRGRVRMLRIDAPEDGEKHFHEARDALAAMIGDGPVYLATERPGELGYGDRGRVLAYALVDDRNLNVEMVREGWSKFWTLYGPGRFGDSFLAAEAEARDAGRRVWVWREDGLVPERNPGS